MSREELVEKFNSITDIISSRETLYLLMNELGITFKKTKCVKCLRDYYNIVREELGMIESAAEVSDFNDDNEYVYLLDRAQSWNGHIINNSTPVEVIREFVKTHKGYYKL